MRTLHRIHTSGMSAIEERGPHDGPRRPGPLRGPRTTTWTRARGAAARLGGASRGRVGSTLRGRSFGEGLPALDDDAGDRVDHEGQHEQHQPGGDVGAGLLRAVELGCVVGDLRGEGLATVEDRPGPGRAVEPAPDSRMIDGEVSPRARPRPSIEALMTPGLPKGSTAVRIISHRVAPSARAPSLWVIGVWAKTSREIAVTIGRTMIDSTMPVKASCSLHRCRRASNSGIHRRASSRTGLHRRSKYGPSDWSAPTGRRRSRARRRAGRPVAAAGSAQPAWARTG